MMVTVLGRAPSTLSRESARNATRGRPNRAWTAHMLATGRARQPRRPRKLLEPWLWQYVRTHLAEGCSPEQIAGRLRRAYPDDMRKHLSAETIYVSLYVLPRGTLRSELLVALRQARKARRPRPRGTDRRGQISHITPIAKRPVEMVTRKVPGYWEGDPSREPAMGRSLAPWWSGRPAWSSWPGWTERIRGVSTRASRRNFGMSLLRCGKP